MEKLETHDVALRLILTVVTCGLFGLYWIADLTNDIHRLSGKPQTPKGLTAALLTFVTCSVYFYYWLYKISGELVEARREMGLALDSVKNSLYTVAIVFMTLVATALSVLGAIGDMPPELYQDLNHSESLVPMLIYLLVVITSCFVLQCAISAFLLWFVYKRTDPNPRIVYMLMAVLRLNIVTLAFVQASFNNAVIAGKRLKKQPVSTDPSFT